MNRDKNQPKRNFKTIILIVGSIIICGSYLGYLITSSSLGFSTEHSRGIATILFAVCYFGLFIGVKKAKKGFFKSNKLFLINSTLLAIPFIAALSTYWISKNFLLCLGAFLVCQIMLTIYYNNFIPVPGYQKGYKLFKANNKQESIKVLNDILQKYPESYETLILLGNIYISEMQYNKAIEVLEKAKEVEPENHITYINLSNAYTSAEMFDKAIEASLKLLELEKPAWNTLYAIGLCSLLNKDYKTATKFYKKTLEYKLPPAQYVLVHYGLTKSYTNLNQENKASLEHSMLMKYATEPVITYWEKQLSDLNGNMNKPSKLVQETLEYIKSKQKSTTSQQ